MGILVGYPNIGGTEKDLQLNFGLPISEQVEMRTPHLPAEWFPQSGVQLTWPHVGTDWAYMLEEVQQCFVQIAREIASREKLLIVTPEPDEVLKQIENQVNMDHVVFLQAETNDTWARDHGAITMLDGSAATLLDFKFNGWGLKFASDKDNLITRRLFIWVIRFLLKLFALVTVHFGRNRIPICQKNVDVSGVVSRMVNVKSAQSLTT